MEKKIYIKMWIIWSYTNFFLKLNEIGVYIITTALLSWWNRVLLLIIWKKKSFVAVFNDEKLTEETNVYTHTSYKQYIYVCESTGYSCISGGNFILLILYLVSVVIFFFPLEYRVDAFITMNGKN